jgi:hypothetical protein
VKKTKEEALNKKELLNKRKIEDFSQFDSANFAKEQFERIIKRNLRLPVSILQL